MMQQHLAMNPSEIYGRLTQQLTSCWGVFQKQNSSATLTKIREATTTQSEDKETNAIQRSIIVLPDALRNNRGISIP